MLRTVKYQHAKWALRIATVSLAAMLMGCGLPASAPTSRELLSDAGDAGRSYAVVKMDHRVATILAKQYTSFGPTFRGERYVPSSTLRSGDAVSITIFEAGGSSLFPPPANSMAMLASTSTMGAASGTPPPSPGPTSAANTIPAQTIEADGTIQVPFVGRMKVAGLNPAQVGVRIQKALQEKAVAPQVVVTLATNTTNTATVGGEVNLAKLVPLSLRGERLLDVIAAAGGPKWPAYESYVEVVRNGQVSKMLLQTVVSNSAENVIVQPNDQIYLTRNPRSFVVLGATQRPSLYPFDQEKVTLAEAIAKAGGSVDVYGDPSGIYLLRYEPWRIAEIVVDQSYLNEMAGIPPEFVPVLYRLDLRSAEGYFLAQSVPLRDKDIVLITNAEAVQLLKMLTLVRGFTGIAYDLKKQYTP